MRLYIPEQIKEKIENQTYNIDDIGMSASTVVTFENAVLKIEKQCEESDNEHRMMKWLEGRLPVPKAVCSMTENSINYLLMSKVRGKMLCDEHYMQHPNELVSLLVQGLKMLWSVDIKECPYKNTIDNKLRLAEYRVKNNLCSVDDVEEDTYGENGFENPEHLLQWLKENKPQEQLVFSHGDYCLPNIFVENGKIAGFIDLGRSGVADIYQDIALCYRSLIHNFSGKYDGKQYSDFKPEMLFEELEMEPDWDKIKYYCLLDELF